MASYRLLEDHWLSSPGGGMLVPAGSIVSDQPPNPTIPVGWTPTPNVDPLDASAVTAFYAQGPVKPGRLASQFSNAVVNTPATYWKAVASPVGFFGLTGLGASLPALPGK